MTLKEKFITHTKIPNIFGIWIKDLEAANQCEQIADDYAIEFYKWMIDNIHIFHELSIWNKEHKKYSEKELLEIFKKEKGL
jgi:hypothetical protein